jgi:substrate import-associated zinc metallohydrolase lipoprotein
MSAGFLFLSSCRSDDLTGTIFEDRPDLDETLFSYSFDKWLYDNYLIPYNLLFKYKMEDVAADMNYNLVPCSFQKAKEIAVMTKYLWFDVYDNIVDTLLLKEYGPKIIHLIGSPAYNPANGTIKLGEAEEGIKVTFFNCNHLVVTDMIMMNEYLFKTMHHEFGHILHQAKLYPAEFRTISSPYYQPMSWQDRNEKVANSLGLVSQYAGNVVDDDWVEIIAHYIVKSDEEWNQILYRASKGWKVKIGKDGRPEQEYDQYGRLVDIYVEAEADTDGVDGKAVIERKLELVKKYFKDQWNADLDALRKEVQIRQENLDLPALLSEIDGN